MDKDTHVYCTNCIHFEDNLKCIEEGYFLNNPDKKQCGNCKCIVCDCLNPEDSAPFSKRPNYIFID